MLLQKLSGISLSLSLLSLVIGGCSHINEDNSSKPFVDIQNTQVNKPNVILIYADDISAREFSFYQSTKWSGFEGKTVSDPAKLAQIPVLTKIANEGVFIDNAWAATICSPSRAMMMTGRYASTHKWWHNGDYGLKQEKNGKKRRVKLFETSPLLIGNLAQNAGYKTIWVGKTQMGHQDQFDKFGFDEGVFTPGIYYPDLSPHTSFGIHSKTQNGKKVLFNVDSGELVKDKSYVQQGWYWKPNVQLMNHPSAKSEFEYWPNTPESIKNYGVNTFGPDVELDFIFDFMERQHQAEKPFFVYHTSHLGHDAFDFLQPDSKDKWPGTPIVKWDGEKYTRVKPNITGAAGQYNLNNSITEPGIHNHIQYLDYQIWRYLQKLKEMQIENDTILIFAADNGTSGYGKGNHAKQAGTHVPLVIYAPGSKMTKQGKQPIIASIADILPTLADIMDEKIPQDYEIHGESLWPYLTTKSQQHREWVYSYKQEKSLIRSLNVMKDGNNHWWDVSSTPSDLDSYDKITDWNKVPKHFRQERDMLNKIIPKFDTYKTAHDF